MTEENKNTETSEQIQAIGITPVAAKLICEIIAICTKRGAFNPNELTAVGNLYDQLLAQIPEELLQSTEETEIEVTPEEEVQLELELEEATK